MSVHKRIGKRMERVWIVVCLLAVVVMVGVYLWRRNRPRESTFWRFQPVSYVGDDAGERERVEVNDWAVIDEDVEREPVDVRVDSELTHATVGETEGRMGEMAAFLCAHYLRRPPNAYAPTRETVRGVFTARDTSGGGLVTLAERAGAITGMITSRPLQAFLGGSGGNERGVEMPRQRFVAHYVDMMCVHSAERDGRLARALIATHERFQRRHDPTRLVSVFRREDELLAKVRPIVSYTCMAFETASMFAHPTNTLTRKRDERMRAVTEERDLRVLFTRIQERGAQGQFALLPPTASNFVALMRQPDYRVWSNRTYDAAFVFRDARLTLLDPRDRVVGLIYASWPDALSTSDAWNLLRACEMPEYTHMMVDLVGQTTLLAPSCAAIAFVSTPVQYYMYNLSVPRTLDAALCNIIH